MNKFLALSLASSILALAGCGPDLQTACVNYIDAANGCSIQRNTVRSSSGAGLRLGSQSAYRENTLTGNGGGCVLGGANAGDNSCNGS